MDTLSTKGPGLLDWVDFDNRIFRLFFLLLLGDLAFILLQIPYKLDVFSEHEYRELFRIQTEGGFADVYMYCKELWCVALLLLLAFKRRHFIYFGWTAFFGYILADDSLEIHERLGAYLGDTLQLGTFLNMRPGDIGELLASLIAGTILLGIVGIGFLLCNRPGKVFSAQLVGLIAILVFFGIFVDALHMVVARADGLFGVVEDGGEMIAISLIVGYLFSLDLDDDYDVVYYTPRPRLDEKEV